MVDTFLRGHELVLCWDFDRCEPFDTYPRTYDLLHAVGLFSAEESRYAYKKEFCKISLSGFVNIEMVCYEK